MLIIWKSLQFIGRSSRLDNKLPLLGAILASIYCDNIESLELSFKDNYRNKII
jgi:hypothetical protein